MKQLQTNTMPLFAFARRRGSGIKLGRFSNWLQKTDRRLQLVESSGNHDYIRQQGAVGLSLCFRIKWGICVILLSSIHFLVSKKKIGRSHCKMSNLEALVMHNWHVDIVPYLLGVDSAIGSNTNTIPSSNQEIAEEPPHDNALLRLRR